jgi:biotin transport system substrate-specific component
VQLKVLAVADIERQGASSCAALLRVMKLLAFVCLTSVAAQLAVDLPFTPVPVTMQTLFVVLAGVTLGALDGFCAMLAYISLGFAGVPVFAGFSCGPAVLFGPTGGYLVSFPAAALLAGYISRVLGGKRLAVFAASLCGMALILVIGASHLALIAGLSFPRAASMGIAPFVAGEFVKALVASLPPARRTSLGGAAF